MLESLMKSLDKKTDSATIDRMIKSLKDYQKIYPTEAKTMGKVIKLLDSMKKNIDHV